MTHKYTPASPVFNEKGLLKMKKDCLNCAHMREKKDYVQQPRCKKAMNPKDCNAFVDKKEWGKYLEMIGETSEDD